MADLLTAANKAQIDQALLDAMNTLHRSPISLFVKSLSLDVRQINTGVLYTEYALKTIISEKNKANLEGVEGARDIDQIKTKFHRQDFISLGLIGLDGELLFNSAESYFIYLGKKYRIISVVQEDIAVRIEAEPSPINI
jgi:hypothetical protein|tara:strand:- start:1361 stop:1777 length:417 start_codon:yes stop_codon:yes gene_type:complete